MSGLTPPTGKLCSVTSGNRPTAQIGVAIAGLLVLASTLLPWATYENRTVGTTTEYGSGSVGCLLAALTVAAVACALAGVSHRSATLRRLGIAFAAGCLVCAVALALAAIISANDASSVGGGRTARASGTFVGILGSLALLIGCSVLRQSESNAEGRIATPLVDGND